MAHLSKKFTTQGIENTSFHEPYKILRIAGYGWDAAHLQYVAIAVDVDGHLIVQKP